MKSKAQISVIIPMHDAAGRIGEVAESLKLQTITGLECILVDAASSDGTADEALRCTDGDERFVLIRNEEGGLTEARNAGLEAASGEYVMFADDDVTFAENGLELLYNTANRHGADLAADAMYRLRGETGSLSPLDPSLAERLDGTGLLLRRSVIEENGLRFDGFSRGAEMLFLKKFAEACDVVYGVKDKIWSRMVLPAGRHRLPAVCTDEKAFGDVLYALELSLTALSGSCSRRLQAAQTAKAAPANSAKEIQNLYDRAVSAFSCAFARTVLIGDVIRYLWAADDGIAGSAQAKLAELRDAAFPLDWEALVREEEADLSFGEDMLPDLTEIRETPKISFAVSDIKDRDKLSRVLECIYSQASPQFEVLLAKDLHGGTAEEWKAMPNLHSLDPGKADFKKAAFGKCRGDFIWFIDKPVYMSASTVRDMCSYMTAHKKPLFVSVPVYSEANQGGSIRPLEANSVPFLPEFSKQKRRTDFNQPDFLWINKLFRMKKLRAMDKPFGQKDWDTLSRFYRNAKYHRIDDFHVISDLTDSDVLAQVKSLKVKLLWRQKLRKEQKFLAMLEARETRQRSVKIIKRRDRNRMLRFLTIKILYPLIYAFSRLKPVDPRKIILVEPDKNELSNSLKGIRRELEKAGDFDIKEMYLGRNVVRKKEQYRREMSFIREMATARYVFTDDAFQAIGGFSKRKETTVVQLWHGCGAFKKFGFSTAELLFGGSEKEKKKYPNYRNQDIVTVSSPEVIWAYEEAMGLEGTGAVKPVGVSRTDIFYDEAYIKKAREKVFGDIPQINGRKVILYAPTFRGSIRKAKGPNRLDFNAMKAALGDEYFLLVKHHPFVKVTPAIPEDCADFALDVSKNGTISATIDDLICCADICISDYSSLVFEYSIFEKPMIFFAYDIEDYNDWRGFYYDYDELTPGPVVYTTDEIIKYIQNLDTEFDRDEIIRFREKFMSACDGHATERLLEAIGIEAPAAGA